MKYKLYALVDPRNNSIRYIGITSRKLKVRLWEHISYKSHSHKMYWINTLKQLGLRPQIICLKEDLSEERACFLEKFLIISLKQMKFNLTNTSSGGFVSGEWTHERKKKISNALRGRSLSEIHKQRIKRNRPNHKGKNHPMYGKKHSQETIEKMRKGKKYYKVLIIIDGQQENIPEWSKISGTPVRLIRQRLHRGWGPKQAVFGKGVI